MIQIDKADCCGCHACANICPQHCLQMDADKEGFWYPAVDAKKCTDCGLCKRTCLSLNADKHGKLGTPICYAALSLNTEERLNSSSGGVFSLLAKQVFKQGGIVFGAAMKDDCRSVVHISIDNEQDLWRLQGSKYVQSYTANTYSEAKAHLQAGRVVLYTGTPC